jgi:hypothetical protein
MDCTTGVWSEVAFRKARLKWARGTWRALRPLEAVGRGRVAKAYLEFHSKRRLGPGLDSLTGVQLMTRLEPSPRLSVRCTLSDVSVAALRLEVQGLDFAGVANCDVLAAHQYLKKDRAAWSLPICEFDAPVDALFDLLKTYARQLDDLWEAQGGYIPDGFRGLALWLLRHRHRTGAPTDLGAACAAYLYGDSDLALTLLLEFEAQWARLAIKDPREVRQQMHAEIKVGIEKLRGIIGRNRRWPHDKVRI